jgi:general secretion pathway protein M
MSTSAVISGYLARFPRIAALCYLAIVLALLASATLSVLDLMERRQAVAATADTLALLEARNPAKRPGVAAGEQPAAPVSPFLEGPTVTVAGAALMERVAGAITRFNGNILSSQVDLQGTQAKDGFVAVSVSCEIEQESLQKLLYDLEAGAPLLFVDQLVAQAPDGQNSALAGKLRVLISVSGQWQGTK